MADLKDPATLTEQERLDIERRKQAKSWQYAQTGDRIDHTMGNMGGAGASASGPDIAEQSRPTPGNSSDEPSR
jgi:hypothetical protein